MARKLRWVCPCGFSFETVRGENQAVAMIQLHVKRAHKDYLPFGITRDEAFTLLRQGFKSKRKLRITQSIR